MLSSPDKLKILLKPAVLAFEGEVAPIRVPQCTYITTASIVDSARIRLEVDWQKNDPNFYGPDKIKKTVMLFDGRPAVIGSWPAGESTDILLAVSIIVTPRKSGAEVKDIGQQTDVGHVIDTGSDNWRPASHGPRLNFNFDYASNRVIITNKSTDEIEIQSDDKQDKLILGQNGTGYFDPDSRIQIGNIMIKIGESVEITNAGSDIIQIKYDHDIDGQKIISLGNSGTGIVSKKFPFTVTQDSSFAI